MMKLFDEIYNFIIKLLICSVIFLGFAIFSKFNINYRDKIHYYLYENTLNFGYLTDLYEKYFGGISFFKDTKESGSKTVFNEKIKYSSTSYYRDGVKLLVDNNYLVPSIYSGIVSYIGSDDNYGSVYVIKNEDNIDVWYGNICNSTLKIYDKIERSDYIGESCSNYIYLVFKKDDNFLDYKDYLN